ncbi:MAG: XRE family transcriptional regulator [Arenicellales bacterium]
MSNNILIVKGNMDEIAKIIGTRLKSERERIGVTQKYFAALGGVGVNSQRNYEAGRNVPDAKYFAAVAHAVDNQYIITGERSKELQTQKSIFNAQSSHGLSIGESQATYMYDDKQSDFQLVPRMDIQVSGGHGALVSSEQVVDHLAFRQDWLEKKGLDPENLALVEIIGDSMEPKLGSGDTVLIDTSQSKIRGGSAYVVRIGEDLVVKYLQLLPGDMIQVSSENPSYPPYTINKEQIDTEFMVIGKVVASNHEWR